MKYIAVTLLAFLILILSSCGSSTPSKSINGIYFAQLKNPDGTQAFMFNTTLAQGSGSAVNISSFNFMSPSPCFPSTTSQTATFMVTGSSNGFATGPFDMTVSTAFPANNVLTLTGMRGSDGNFSGAWTGTGFAGCTGSGSFTMAPPPPV